MQKNLCGVVLAGPLPHSRWLVGYEREAADWSFNFTGVAAAGEAGGSTLRPVGSVVIDDDHVGHVVDGEGEKFCLDARASGNIEVWHAPLVGGKHAVAVVNRSPAANQSFTITWKMLGIAAAEGSEEEKAYTVHDVWRGADGDGAVASSSSTTSSTSSSSSHTVSGLDQRASALLILTPQVTTRAGEQSNSD